MKSSAEVIRVDEAAEDLFEWQFVEKAEEVCKETVSQVKPILDECDEQQQQWSDPEVCSESSTSADSSSRGESDEDVRVGAATAAVAAVEIPVAAKRASQFAGTQWFANIRRGTFHLGSLVDERLLGCGRMAEHGLYEKIDEPLFGFPRCATCFGSIVPEQVG
jgi:hypothetical protein